MNASLRHIIGKSVLFFIAVALAYGATAFVLNRVKLKGRRMIVYFNPLTVRMGGQEYAMTRDFDAAKGYDVFVVGSSHAYRGYDPRIFESKGYRLFNAGSSAQHPMISALVLQSMLPQLKKKPLVVVDLYDRILELDDEESKGRMMINCSDQGLARQIFLLKPDVRAFNTYMTRFLTAPGLQEIELKDYVRDGYCSRTSSVTRDLDAVSAEFKPHPRALKGLRESLHWLTTNGYRCVLASHPMPPLPGRDAFHRAATKAILHIANDLSVPYFDFTAHDFGSDWKLHYWDAMHLNQRGVDVFNALLLDTLQKTSYLQMP